MQLFKKKTREESDIPDELSILLLTYQIYLKQLANIIIDKSNRLSSHKKFDEIIIDESEVSLAVKAKYDSISESMLSQAFNYLVADGYLKSVSDDPRKIVYVSATNKGWVAAMSGEFKIKNQKRQFDLHSLELTKRSIKAHGHQKFVNWMLVITALLSILSPIAVAVYFEHDVIVPKQDIRIDSVWLHGEVDSVIQKTISNQLPKSATEKQLPK